MADMQYYIDRVAKAEETVEKKKGTIELHEKQLVKKLAIVADLGATVENIDEKIASVVGTGNDRVWQLFDVKGKLDDIKGATKNLKVAEETLKKWKEKLAIQINQEKFLADNVPEVIKYFLGEWLENSFDWYVVRLKHYKRRMIEISADAELTSDEKYKSRNMVKLFSGALVVRMSEFYNEDKAYEYLLKELEQDKLYKMLDLAYRIKAAVGEITDAEGLYVANGTGNLNGFIIGVEGKAKVETIGAGGHPDGVQCFHYRTLIHKLKEE